MPTPITPEMLIKGRDLVSLNLIPELQSVDSRDLNFTLDNIRSSYAKLEKTNSNLIDIYHEEFMVQLISQATDKIDRYRPKTRTSLKAGDVLLVEKFLKQSNYPMGIVISVIKNSLGESVTANIFKGITREKVYRHVSSLILLVPADERSYAANDVSADDVVHSAGPGVVQLSRKR